MTGENITMEAFSLFGRWCRIHDPDGNLGILEAVTKYNEWCDYNDPMTLKSKSHFSSPQGSETP